MTKRDRQLRLCMVLLVLNLCFIWGNSLLPAEQSQALSDWMTELLGRSAPGGTGAAGGSGLLRKLAHFIEFTALGFVLRWLYLILNKSGWMPFVWGTAAACIDEIIQIFVPGRGPGLMDVGIDVCGVAMGILLLQIGYHIRQSIHLTQNGGN